MDIIFHQGVVGEVYNIAANDELSNLDMVKLIMNCMNKKLEIEYVQDRCFNDANYRISDDKLRSLGWSPRQDLKQGLYLTSHFINAS